MRLRNLLLVGLLGLVAAALPAMASSETTPTVEAKTGSGPYSESHSWSPAQVTIAAGGAVVFANHSSEVPHGVIWTSSVKPTCEEGSGKVPVGAEHFGYQWSGSCRFSQAGTYTFECSVHHQEMTGTITVTAAGSTTTSTTTPPPTPTPTSTTPTPTPKPPALHPGNARKLAKALRACRKKPKGRRAACIRRAHRRYGRR